jgi:hypothetical protein
LGVQVVWVALHFDGTAILNRGEQGTGIWAVVWTQTAHHRIFFKD